MAYYERVKTSRDGQPVWENYLSIILNTIPKKVEWKSRELKRSAVQVMELPDKIQEKRYKEDDYETIAENRAGFALSLLKNAGLVTFLGSAKYSQNDEGNAFFKKFQGNISEDEIKKLPTYLKHKQLVAERRERKNGKPGFDINGDDQELPIDKKMSLLQDQYNDSVANDLLERIWQMDPYAFETLVVNLLIAMGYKGVDGSAFVTQKSNDGEIDGVINQDPLGTQTVYVQAKRYGEKNSVQRQEVTSFYGAITENHSNKGVFITSSSFTKGATEAAKQLGILTIDGIQLTGFMVQYQVGVRTKHKYELYDVDEEFFEAD